MKLLVVVFAIGFVDGYDFQNTYSANIVHKNPKYPDQDAQSAFEVQYGSPPNFYRNDFPVQTQNDYRQPSQEFNVGYSVSFTNGSPSKPRHHYLSPDIVMGSRKEQIAKPPGHANSTPRTRKQLPEAALNSGDFKGTSWQNLGSNVEMFHSTQSSFDGANGIEKESLPKSFDHAKALGRSQGFDFTDVIGANGVQPEHNRNYHRVSENSHNVETQLPKVKYQYVSVPMPSTYAAPTLTVASTPVSIAKVVANEDETVTLENLPSKSAYYLNDDAQTKFNADVNLLRQRYQYGNPKNPSEDVTPHKVASENQKYRKPAADVRYVLSSHQAAPNLGALQPQVSSYQQYPAANYFNWDALRPTSGFSFAPEPIASNQLYQNYRFFNSGYGQPHRYYYEKNENDGRVVKKTTKFIRGVSTGMQPPEHRSLPRFNWTYDPRQLI